MFEKIYKDLDKIINIITKGKGKEHQDLKQEVILYLLTSEKVKELYSKDIKECMLYVYGTTYRMYHLPRSPYNYKMNKYKEKNLYINDDLCLLQLEGSDNVNIEYEIEQFKQSLSSFDRLWLDEYHNRNTNKNRLQKDTKISRKRINDKLNRLKLKAKQWI